MFLAKTFGFGKGRSFFPKEFLFFFAVAWIFACFTLGVACFFFFMERFFKDSLLKENQQTGLGDFRLWRQCQEVEKESLKLEDGREMGRVVCFLGSFGWRVFKVSWVTCFRFYELHDHSARSENPTSWSRVVSVGRPGQAPAGPSTKEGQWG